MRNSNLGEVIKTIIDQYIYGLLVIRKYILEKYKDAKWACNTYNSNAGDFLLTILTKMLDLKKQNYNLCTIKNSLPFFNNIKKLNNIKNMKMSDFNYLFNIIDIIDMFRIINLLFKDCRIVSL